MWEGSPDFCCLGDSFFVGSITNRIYYIYSYIYQKAFWGSFVMFGGVLKKNICCWDEHCEKGLYNPTGRTFFLSVCTKGPKSRKMRPTFMTFLAQTG